MTVGRLAVAIAVIAIAVVGGYCLYDNYIDDDDAPNEVRYVINATSDGGTQTGPFEDQRRHIVSVQFFTDADSEKEVTAWVGNVQLETATGITDTVRPGADSYELDLVLPDGTTYDEFRDGLELQFDGVDGVKVTPSDGTDGPAGFVLEEALVGTVDHNGVDEVLLYLMVNFTADTEPTFTVGDIRLQEASGIANMDGLFEITRLAGIDMMLYVFEMPEGLTVDDVLEGLSAEFGGVEAERLYL